MSGLARIRCIPKPTRTEYDIALRPHQDGTLDDVVVRNVHMFRLEDMGEWWWMCCYLGGDPDDQATWERICFSMPTGVGRVIDFPVGDFTYEPGSIRHEQ